MNFNLLKTFIKVAEFGSFTKAARQLKQPKSRVSRSISRLEEDLKVELIRRSTRSLSLTEAGKKLYMETQGLIHQLEKKIKELSKDEEEISGVLSISAPIDFGESVMPKLLSEFSMIHPKVTFRILLSDSYIDLTAHDIDIALRVGRLPDSNMKQKKLTETELILVASKEYENLKGLPQKWEDMANYELLSFYSENHQDVLSEMYQIYGLSPAMRINSFPMLRKLALDSRGIAVLPNAMCKKDLTQEDLIRVIPEWSHRKSPLQMVFSPNKNLPSITRAFVDFVYERRKTFF